jgi:hypothetical protein
MATEIEMKTLTCPGPPEHEFQIPKGRGRPPRYCDDHDPKKDSSRKGGEKVTEQPRPRPRPKPAEAKSGGGETKSRPRPAPRVEPTPKDPKDVPSTGDDKATMSESGKIERVSKSVPKVGTPDTGSRAKGESAANRAVAVQSDDAIPRGVRGRPMAKLEFSASELVPTGQYANVTIGPVRATVWIDLDRELGEDDTYFSTDEATKLVKAANELAEHIEGSVIAVQREIVLMNLQEDGNGKS